MLSQPFVRIGWRVADAPPCMTTSHPFIWSQDTLCWGGSCRKGFQAYKAGNQLQKN